MTSRYTIMPKTISSNQLNVNATYLVRGKLGFSRLARQTTDEEREKANARRMHPIDKNYTTVTVYDATVICKDPTAPSIEEQYAAESFYKSSSPNSPGNNFTAINKSKFLPRIGVLNPQPGNPNHYDEVTLEGELASGLDVTIVMHVFMGQGRKGVSFDRVLVNEPIRYFGGDHAIDQALSDYGITFTAQPRTAATPAQASAAAPAAQDEPIAPEAPAMESAFSAAPAAPAAPASVAPPAADNPFSSVGAGTPANLGPGTRQY